MVDGRLVAGFSVKNRESFGCVSIDNNLLTAANRAKNLLPAQVCEAIA